jgi:site-specific DNA recombinase
LTAFENGTLDESICGRRIAELQTQLDQLTAQQAELGELEEVRPPSVAAIERIRQSLSDILRSGTLGQRKAVMETHIAEIRITGDRLIPVYRIPADTFRARGQVVGRAGLEPATEGL